MAHEVPRHILSRLFKTFNELRDVVGPEAAKAYLNHISNVEPVELEPEPEPCDDSWMEFINKVYITDRS